MATVIISKELENIIDKKFKKQSVKVFSLLYSLEKNPKKGKIVGQVGGLIIKEIKYEGFRFYFIADGYKLKVFTEVELTDLLIKFVRISDKKDQQEIINEIKKILINLGPEGFNI